MQDTLLSTKLYIPQARQGLVSRPRLTERLDAGLHSKLTLISAPAGFGKSTLISTWLTLQNQPFTWLSLDESDNDLALFLSYVVYALQQVNTTLGVKILSLLQSQQLSAEQHIPVLINEIATFDQSFILVLDDYHTITLPAIHEAIRLLLNRMPLNMHLIIVTRQDPPLGLSRFRAQRQLTEIRAIDLRFNEEETNAFLNRVMCLNLPATDINALNMKTEGWIVGLQLAALSLQAEKGEYRTRFIEHFTGSHAYIVDYLTDEVLRHQPASIRSFFLQTSILDILTGSLCDAVTQQTGGQLMLEYFDKSNLFVLSLDHERHWYRYHHLFAELLRNQLFITQSDQVPILHQRASTWFARHNLVSKAIEHSLAARDFQRAAELTEITFMDRMSRGEDFTAMLKRLTVLPDEIIRESPRFSIMYAWMLAIMFQLDEVEPRLKEVEQKMGAELEEDFRLQITQIRAGLARYRGDYTKCIDLSLDVYENLPENPTGTRLQTYTGTVTELAWSSLYLGSIADAEKWFSKVLTVSKQSITLTLLTLRGIALTFELQGKLTNAYDVYQHGLRLVDGYKSDVGNPLTAAVYIYFGIGDVLREWNRLEEAAHYISLGIELGVKRQIGPDTLRDGYLSQARLRQVQGNYNGALSALKQAADLAEKYANVPNFDRVVVSHRARLALVQARMLYNQDNKEWINAVQEWADAQAFMVISRNPTIFDEFDLLTWISFLILLQQPGKAIKLLEGMKVDANKNGRGGRELEILIHQALAYQSLEDQTNALKTLKKALITGKKEHYRRVFIEQGKPMAVLLHQFMSTSPSSHSVQYCQEILGEMEQEMESNFIINAESTPQSAEPSRSFSAPFDSLSIRELEVLRLLNTELSTREIAAQLVVSNNTIKTHIKHIYDKLSVHSRFEAISRAKELDLL